MSQFEQVNHLVKNVCNLPVTCLLIECTYFNALCNKYFIASSVLGWLVLEMEYVKVEFSSLFSLC